MMGPNSESLHSMLVRQGIEAGRGETRKASERAKRAGTREAANGVASTTNELREGKPPAALAYGWEGQPMGTGKGRAVNAPAKVQALRVVVDNSRCKPMRDPTRVAPRGIGFHLVLVQ